jgi:hypothetical protein
MAAQIANPRAAGGNPAAAGASFLLHLGDVVYKDDDPSDPDGKDQSGQSNRPKQPADDDSALPLLVVRNGGLLCHLSLHE